MPSTKARGYSVVCFLPTSDDPALNLRGGVLWVEHGLWKGDFYVPESWPVWLIIPGYLPVIYTTIEVSVEEAFREFKTDWGVFKSPITALKSVQIESEECVDLRPLPVGWKLVKENE